MTFLLIITIDGVVKIKSATENNISDSRGQSNLVLSEMLPSLAANAAHV